MAEDLNLLHLLTAQLLTWLLSGERRWHDDHERAIKDQGQSREPGDTRTQREAFFREEQDRQERHHLWYTVG